MELEKLAQLKSGDPVLFAELVRDHHRALIALTVPIVGISEAEEVVQNAWLKAYQAISSFAGKSAIRTWLGSIAINEAKMQLRQRKRESLFSDHGDENQYTEDSLAQRFTERGHWQHPPAHWHTDSPESLLTGEQLAECLEKLLTAMPDNQRCILEMRDASGLPFDEICSELTVSSANARVLLHRARTQLFKLVDHYEETGEC
ncbi:sigma-70 family RNA polymerase sigma factor [uncultured Porticoccus sp.]|uniref:sigma-70 family RNA polymerase sigma factor n=1 Tax=uncultured Porticoccus sp. TaxID=1256050 RepID=UPI00261132AE|nr:sigma-70 family RNA polymerase sigma factor [uncultured Porticoccus sp.]